jgi:hypothetical protein
MYKGKPLASHIFCYRYWHVGMCALTNNNFLKILVMSEFADLCFMFENFMAMSYNFCTGKLCALSIQTWGYTVPSIKYLSNILHSNGSGTFIIAVKEMCMNLQHIYNSCNVCFHAINVVGLITWYHLLLNSPPPMFFYCGFI